MTVRVGSTLVIAEDNDQLRRIISQQLRGEGYNVFDVSDGPEALDLIRKQPIDLLVTDLVMPTMGGIELLEQCRSVRPELRAIVITGHGTRQTVINAFKNHACDFLTKPFTIQDFCCAVERALERKDNCSIQVVSSKPDWIELKVPCDLAAVEPLVKFMDGIECDLPHETREAIGSAFREMLLNAMEHGGKLDPTKYVEVRYVRLKRAVLYSIKDPGEGFHLGEISHAAVTNPEHAPFQHMKVRQELGLRPGGYGILLASQAIDELVYNERHNELIFVKYLDPQKDESI